MTRNEILQLFLGQLIEENFYMLSFGLVLLPMQDGNFHVPYLTSVLKKIIVEVESHGFEVLDELYERIAFYMTSVKVVFMDIRSAMWRSVPFFLTSLDID